MGLLIEGKWLDQWYDTVSTGGKFERSIAQFRNWITKDGSAGPTGKAGFKAETGRYHLYASYACPWVHRVLIYRKLKGLEKAITSRTAAIMVETIMGEGGIKVIPDFCLKGLRKLCNKKKILLILDEVQCGIGRSGKFFAFEHAKIKPDIVPIAKGIGGGFPIGAVLVNKKVASGMKPGTHGSTFGGNPLAMSAGNAVMDLMFKKGFLSNVTKNGNHFLKGLKKLKEKYPKIIKEVRGKGLLIGLCLHRDQTKFIQKLMDNKLLTIRAAENVVRLLPPLNVTKQEINLGLKILDKVCKNYR